MRGFNQVTLAGNLTRTPEVRYTPKGTAVVDITLALNRTWKDDTGHVNEEVTFVDVTFWSGRAELLGQYCKKGDALLVTGRLAQDTWEDKETGQKRTKLKVVGDDMTFLARSGGPKPAASAPAPQPPTANRQPPTSAPDMFPEGGDARYHADEREGIPF